MLETREIECFLAVADERHFGRAAQRLQLSTSRVSQTVRAVERRIGGQLFTRTSRKVELTPLGEQLRAGLVPAYGRLQRVIAETRQAAAEQRPTLTVGFSGSIPAEVQSAIAAAYRAKHAGHQLITVPVNPMDMFLWDDRVGTSLDAIVGWLPPGPGGRISSTLSAGPAIRRSPSVLLMSQQHPLAGRESIHVEELADLEVLLPASVETLRAPWVPASTPNGRPIRSARHDVRYIQSLVALIAGSRLVHLTIADFRDILPLSGLTVVPVAGRGPFTCRAVWPTARTTPHVQAFAQLSAQAGNPAE
jgi:DNA-binding transcriptional LysR family regulator